MPAKTSLFTLYKMIMNTLGQSTVIIVFLTLLAQAAYAQGTADVSARPDRGTGLPGSYSISDIESINLVNGNVSLRIPLAALPPIAGGKLSWVVTANYNSKLWNLRSEQEIPDAFHSSTYVTHRIERSFDGGWKIGGIYQIHEQLSDEDIQFVTCSGSECQDATFRYKRFLVMPDGARHELRPLNSSPYAGLQAWRRGYYASSPNTIGATMRYYSFDGSYLTATVNPDGQPNRWTLYLPDGTRVEQQSDGIQRIYDTNGNKIKIYTEGDPLFGITTTHYVDEQTGREIKMFVNAETGLRQVQYQVADGNWVTIDVVFGETAVQGLKYNINDRTCPDVAFGVEGLKVVREIILPQTEAGLPRRKYIFSYNSDVIDAVNFQYRAGCGTPVVTVTSASHGWGALSKMVMPSGAEVEYDYSLDGPARYNSTLPMPPLLRGTGKEVPRERITQKRVKHDGQTDTWIYNNHTVNPDGSRLEEYGWPSDPADASYVGGSNGKNGLIYRTVRYAPGLSSKIIVERQWGHKIFDGAHTISPNGMVVFNPVVDAEYTTLAENEQLIKMSAKKFQYDFNGNITQTTEYDWFDPALVTRDSNGVPTDVPPGAVILRTTTTGYYNPATTSNSGNVYAIRALGTGVPLILNAQQQTVTGPSQKRFSYDNQAYGVAPSLGNLTQVGAWDDRAGVWRNTTYIYDSYGNKTAVTDPNNNVTNIAFDPATHAQPTQVTVNPLNGSGAQTTTTVYDYWTGLITSVTDPNNQTATTSYINHLLGAVDPFGRPGIVTGPPVNSVVDGVTYANQQRKVKTTYFDAARQTVVESDLNQTGDYKLKSRTTRDQLGRVIETEGNEDGAANYSISIENVYVQPGLITLTSNPRRGASATTDGWTRTTRDPLGRVIEAATFYGATQPPNTGTNSNWTGSVTTSYNANQTTVTDQAGKKRRSITDALGRIVRVVEDPDGVAHLTDYSYDTLGKLIVVNQGGQYRYFFYNSLGRLIRAKNPEQSANSSLNLASPPAYNNSWSMAYSYDANGNLVSKTDASNITTTYGYDALNRNTSVDYSNTAINPDIMRQYDGVPNGKGLLWADYAGGINSTDPVGEHNAIDSYDALGRPLTKRQQFKQNGVWSAPYSVSYTYDLAGNVKTMTYPSGRAVNYIHDQAGRLSGFSGNLGGSQRTYADTIGYNAAGQMIKERFGTNTSLYHNSHYNNRMQLVSTRVGDSETDEWNWSRGAIGFYYGTTAVNTGDLFASDTDNNGNLRRQANYVPLAGGGYVIPQLDDYTYDALNRVSSFTEAQRDSGGQWINAASQQYSYDPYGNRRIIGSSGGVNNYNPTYDLGSNRIVGLGYDQAGNITSDLFSGGTMIYDAENRLLTASAGGTYAYDANGKRTRRTVGGQEIWHVYGVGGVLLAEYAANAAPSAPQKEYGYRGGQLLIVAENGLGGGTSFVKPASQSRSDLIGKIGLGAGGPANRIFSADEPFAALGINKDYGSLTANSSYSDNDGTLVRGGPRAPAEEYGDATSANGIGGELLAKHLAGDAPSAPQEEYRNRNGLSIVTAQSNSVVPVNPTVVQTPDSGQGGMVVSLQSNTGHGATITGSSAVGSGGFVSRSDFDAKSAKWSDFQPVSGAIVSVRLKFNWSVRGTATATASDDGGSASSGLNFKIDYSLNGGSGWTNRVTRSLFVAGVDDQSIDTSGAEDILLSPGQNITQVQVRDYMNTAAEAQGGEANSSRALSTMTTAIWDIRLEVEIDTTAPAISNVAAAGITTSGATITWNTNENSDSQVVYGTTQAYGQSTTLNPALVTAHSQVLSGLAAGMTYYYRVKSKDAAGNQAVSGEFTFKTLSNNDAAYVSQSVPATMTAGETYAVTVRMLNQGITTWTPGQAYRLGSQNPQDNTTWGLGRVNLLAGDSVSPGATATFSFVVTAPSSPGSYNFQWQMVQDGVEWFGAKTPNMVIQVVSRNDSAEFISQTAPSVMVAGAAYSVSLTFRNTGNTTWKAANNYRLGSQNPENNGTWGLGRVDLGAGELVPPGALKTFSFQVMAPSTPGPYNFQWRMLRELVNWFGAASTNLVVVTFSSTDTTPPTAASFSPTGGATNVGTGANVTVTFSEAVDPATVNGSTLELRDPSNALVSATVSYNVASLTATLDPTASLALGTTYTARVRGGGTDPRVKDVAGNALAADVTWSFTTTQSGGIKWLVTDHLGSTRMVIDETGSLAGITRHDFLPFGEELFAGPGIRNASNGYRSDSVRQKFDGYERDTETSLDFAQARYFGSMQGRFTSVDPYNPITDSEKEEEFQQYLLEPRNWNRYVYVWNNPLKYIDPTGEKVYIIGYSIDNGAGDEEFKRVAETLKKEIENLKGFDKNKDFVIIGGVKTKEDFKNLVDRASAGGLLEKTYGKVGFVAYVSHGGPIDGPYFQWGTRSAQQDKDYLKNLNINWDRAGNAFSLWLGCNTAPFAQEFANAQYVNSYGFDDKTSFSNNAIRKDKSYVLIDPLIVGEMPLYMVTRKGRLPVQKVPQ